MIIFEAIHWQASFPAVKYAKIFYKQLDFFKLQTRSQAEKYFFKICLIPSINAYACIGAREIIKAHSV